jgi:hypothetical protein
MPQFRSAEMTRRFLFGTLAALATAAGGWLAPADATASARTAACCCGENCECEVCGCSKGKCTGCNCENCTDCKCEGCGCGDAAL